MNISKYVRPGDIKGNTVYDVILKAWLSHKTTDLPPDQKTMLERWEQADRLLRNGELVTLLTEDGPVQKMGRFNVSKVVEWLKERYQVSARTAYEDVYNAKRFFLSCEGRPDKEYERAIAITFGESLMERCEEKGDLKAAAALFKELNKIKGLHEQSIDAPDYAEFQPPKLVITSDPTELGFERVENPDDIVKRILGESRQNFLESEAQDAEVIE